MVYQLGEILGRGSEAVIYNNIVNCKEVLKVFRKKLEGKKEFELVKNLHHRNIIQYYEYIETDNLETIIIMEKITSMDLRRIIFSHRTIKLILIQLLDGLQYLHQNNIIHNDIKIENLLFSNTEQLKIIDFGYAAILSPGSRYSVYSGTPNYIPPELLLHQGVSFPRDVWAVGIILYYLVIRYFPFADPNEDLKQTWIYIKNLSFINSEKHQNKNDLALDLISKILVYENVRYSIEEILQHPYLTT